jgi:hypothetical protein
VAGTGPDPSRAIRNTVVPVLHASLGEFENWQLPQRGQDIGPCRALNSATCLTAPPQIVGQISGEGIADVERTRGGNKIACYFPCLAVKEIASLRLCLGEREYSKVVRITGVVCRAKRFVMLPASFIAEPGNPFATFRSASITKGAASRNNGPIWFGASRQFCPR